MIGSNLTKIKILAKNKYNVGRFDSKIETITIHHMVAIWTAERLGNYWNEANRETSSHYGIGNDGSIGQYVSETDTAWTNGSRASNKKAITIEVANEKLAPGYEISNKAMESLIQLVYDIAKRNNLLPLVKGETLTWHNFFDKRTSCPGPYLTSKLDYIIERVNSMNETFKVGTIVYNKEDVILYGTAGYDTLVQYVLPKNSESKVFKYHSVNGLYMALKDMNDEFYPATWTKEFDKFTIDKPIMCNCDELKKRIQELEANPIIKEVIKEVIVEKPIEVIKEVPIEIIKEKDYTIGELIQKLVNKILKKE